MPMVSLIQSKWDEQRAIRSSEKDERRWLLSKEEEKKVVIM